MANQRITSQIKSFHELTLDELYDILRLRVDVFVVEQACIYPELDGVDKQSLHVFCTNESDEMCAYARVFKKTDEPTTAQIGRVIARKRGCGLGKRVMSSAIRAAFENLGAHEIYIEAQSYARGFYEKLGFKACSKEFLEDGIPHIQMRLRNAR